MRWDENYPCFFSDKTPLSVWVAITEILKRTDELLARVRPGAGGGERFLAKWRNLLAFLAVSKFLGRSTYRVGDLMKFDANFITDALIKELSGIVMAEMESSSNAAFAKSSKFIEKSCLNAMQDFKIEGIEAVGKQVVSSTKPIRASREKKRKELMDKLRTDTAFLDSVNAELPPQPWKLGVVRLVAEKPVGEPAEVSAAIAVLIEQDRRHQQLDGVVYGKQGEIIARDPDRDPKGA
jgi:hypothetical protein